ncbi:DUF7146 domain-containing protein [Vreelandella massiliensis]|uniref:DUF7146 domain-containing protein n=1 Tax=Vreelandella massiliensis TaxID=1816686 RepID=UPI00096A5CF0|nr:toprim domain-containing protein [Halomonas massiliensis]
MMIDRDNEFFKTDEVKQSARGNWIAILSQFGALAPALNKPGRHVPCPKSGQGKDGFRLFPRDLNERGGGIHNDPNIGSMTDGFSLLMWLNDWDFRTTVTEVALILGMEPYRKKGGQPRRVHTAPRRLNHDAESVAKAAQRKLAQQQHVDRQQHQQRLQALWDETLPLTDAQAVTVKAYLGNRGIAHSDAMLNALATGDSLRFHPALAYYGVIERQEMTASGEAIIHEQIAALGHYPALIAAIRDEHGNITTLHRTYLAHDGAGKADVDHPRKMLALPEGVSVTGGAIPLAMPRGILGLAEGLETATAAYNATRLPTWSCVNATLLAGFNPPPDVHTLVVWADRDRSKAGEVAAEQLKSRMKEKGVKVVIMLPDAIIPADEKGVDWNDMLLQHGAMSFPSRQIILDSIANAT